MHHDMFERPPEKLIQQYYQSLANFWHPVLREEDVLSEPVPIQILGQDVVIARLGNEIVALENLCRHFQAKLSDGSVELLDSGEPVIRCRYHGWAYDSEGNVTEIPQVGDTKCRFLNKIRTPKYLVKAKHGIIWLSLTSAPRFEIPEFPECNSSEMESTQIGYTVWNSSLPRMIQSALDDYHFPWLHPGVLGERDRPESPGREIIRDENSLTSHFSTIQPSNVTNSIGGEGNPSVVHYSMVANVPGVARLIKRNEDGGVYVTFFFCRPDSFNKTTVLFRVFRNYDKGPENGIRIMDMERFIQSQDEPLVSGQRPWLMQPTPVPGVDDYLVSYQKCLKDLGIPYRI